MAGPDGLLQGEDPERGVVSARDKTRESVDIQATSTHPSSSDDADVDEPSLGANVHGSGSSNSRNPSSRPLLEKVKGRVPSTVRRRSNTFWAYLKGPDPPKIWKIRPYFPRLQQLPPRLVDKVCPRPWQRILALLVFYVCWIATFAAVLHKSSVAASVPGYGQPILVQCGSTFWYAKTTAPPPPKSW